MTFTLDDKSPDYIESLNKIVEKFKETDPILIKIFCKYADVKHGSIDSRRGIFTLLSEDLPGLLIQDSLPYLLLNPSTLRDAKSQNLDDIEFTRIPKDKIKFKLDKFEKLLYIKERDWHTSIGEVRAIWILSGQIWLRSIDLKYPGYSFDDLNLRKDWKDVYLT